MDSAPRSAKRGGLEVREADLSSYATGGRPSDTTDMDWHATPAAVPERVPQVALVAPPSAELAPPAPPSVPLTIDLPPLPPPTLPPMQSASAFEPLVFQEPVKRVGDETPGPAPPREEISLVARSVQVVVLSVVAGGFAAVVAAAASYVTPTSEGLSVLPPPTEAAATETAP